ncbi:conserved hypothetical protein [uncultured Eubacteriales bacterium]|uniref:Uncharacterized protein n=1 Tax=uncultured Eubacteriales bacterium TaxID=172733 RepID=A0A212KE62_9FIRM|nr:conserved hypothetical protein [uncultured Eubacteriales bacterium]
MTWETLRCALSGVCAYRALLARPPLAAAARLLNALSRGDGPAALEAYAGLFYAVRQEGYDSLGTWLGDALRYEEGPYPLLVEQSGDDPALELAARRDVDTLSLVAGLNGDALFAELAALLPPEFSPLLAEYPRWATGEELDFESLKRFYHSNGAGLFARYRAFLWQEGALRPVADPDCMGGEELIGYERQRNQVIANTRAMLEGNLVNNVLLYGDSGAGKSVTVKSLLAVPGFEDLRLIEVDKDDLGDLPDLIRILAPRRQKFILFIDDLAFDQDDRTYSVLKTILEGGLERRPANVAVYATSNRRHLVRQTFSDRAGDEVDATETIAEKTSLSDRFGLRIPYLSMDKAEFLAMVERMAQQYGITMEREELRAAAVRFEARHPGRTPRVVRQFIASLKM